MNARSVIESLIASWNTQDVESTLAHCSDDVFYALYVAEDAVPFGGVTVGKDAMRATLHMMLEQFDYLRFDRAIVGVDDDVVRVQTQFKFHHRRTGGNLEGTMRTVFRVKDGMVVRCDEYLDQGLVEAFMRLTQQREASGEVVQPPEIPRFGERRPEPVATAGSKGPCEKEECR